MGNQTFLLLVNAVACLIMQIGLAESVFARAPGKQVDAYIKQQMAKYQIPGLSIAVVKSGKVLKLKGYGVSSVEFGIPANENSVFQIYSTTKIFTGVAIMKLVEDGRLSLDTPVTDIIENLPNEWKAIHIRHLLTHTSGLPELRENPRVMSLPDEKKRYLPREEAMRFVAELPLKFNPGEKFMYHTSGYNLLGVIVARLAKKEFAPFLEERIFAPLNMTSTRFGDTEAVIKGRPSTAYNRQGENFAIGSIRSGRAVGIPEPDSTLPLLTWQNFL